MSIFQEKSLGMNSIDKNSPFFICTLFSYVVLKKIVNLSREGLFDEYEYFLGKESAKQLCELQINEGLTGNRGIKAALKEFENMGFGITKIVLLQKNNIILKNPSSSIARQYAKSFFEDKINVDYYIAGVYSGILSSYFGKNIEIEENKCKAKGSEECVFTNTNKVSNKYGLDVEISKALQHQRLSSPEKITYPHFFSKKMFQRGTYSNEDGVIKIANILHVFFRFGFFAFSNHVLSKISEDTFRLHEYLGYVQACIGMEFLKNQFGLKDPDKIFKEGINQLNMLGYGIGSILSRTDKEMTVQFTESLLIKQSIQFMGKFDDAFIKGLLLGLATIYLQPVNNIEFSNPLEDKLIVKVQFGEKTDLAKQLNDKITSEKIKNLSKERMTHKYYLWPS